VKIYQMFLGYELIINSEDLDVPTVNETEVGVDMPKFTGTANENYDFTIIFVHCDIYN